MNVAGAIPVHCKPVRGARQGPSDLLNLMTIIEIKIGYDPSDGKWTAWTEYVGPTGPNDAAATACMRNTYQDAVTSLLQAGTVEGLLEDRKREADAAYELREKTVAGDDVYPVSSDSVGDTG